MTEIIFGYLRDVFAVGWMNVISGQSAKAGLGLLKLVVFVVIDFGLLSFMSLKQSDSVERCLDESALHLMIQIFSTNNNKVPSLSEQKNF